MRVRCSGDGRTPVEVSRCALGDEEHCFEWLKGPVPMPGWSCQSDGTAGEASPQRNWLEGLNSGMATAVLIVGQMGRRVRAPGADRSGHNGMARTRLDLGCGAF
jgi:hypothetical protein